MTEKDKTLKQAEDGGAEGVDQNPPVTTARQAGLAETKETLRGLELKVLGPLNSPGKYVGLSPVQRETVGVKVGDTVELLDNEKSLGLFTVGLGKREYADNIGGFSANVVNVPIGPVTVRKAPQEKAVVETLPLEFGVEKSPKHERRAATLAVRFPDLDQEIYIVVPTPIAERLGLEKAEGSKTMFKISKGSIRIGEDIHEVGIVPAGTAFGLTAKAALKLNIPSELHEIRLSFQDGMLVIV